MIYFIMTYIERDQLGKFQEFQIMVQTFHKFLVRCVSFVRIKNYGRVTDSYINSGCAGRNFLARMRVVCCKFPLDFDVPCGDGTVVSIVSCQCRYCCWESIHGNVIRHCSPYFSAWYLPSVNM